MLPYFARGLLLCISKFTQLKLSSNYFKRETTPCF
jgi:hypothetical protein